MYVSRNQRSVIPRKFRKKQKVLNSRQSFYRHHDIRGSKWVSVYLFLAKQRTSLEKVAHFNFGVMAVGENIVREYTLNSWFVAFLRDIECKSSSFQVRQSVA